MSGETTVSSPFSLNPKLGLNIAEFIASYSMLEVALYQALAHMLGDDDCSITEAVLSRVESVSYKMNVVFDIARLKLDNSDTAKAISDVERDIRSLTKLRNELAHGLFVVKAETQEIGIVSNIFRIGRNKLDGRPITRDEIVAQAHRMIEIMEMISASTSHKGVSLHGGVVTIRPRTDHGGKDIC